jgi:hypothetical protein
MENLSRVKERNKRCVRTRLSTGKRAMEENTHTGRKGKDKRVC